MQLGKPKVGAYACLQSTLFQCGLLPLEFFAYETADAYYGNASVDDLSYC